MSIGTLQLQTQRHPLEAKAGCELPTPEPRRAPHAWLLLPLTCSACFPSSLGEPLELLQQTSSCQLEPQNREWRAFNTSFLLPPQSTLPYYLLSSGWGYFCPLPAYLHRAPRGETNTQMHSPNPGETRKSFALFWSWKLQCESEKRCQRGSSPGV